MTIPVNTAPAETKKSAGMSGKSEFTKYCVHVGLDAIEGESSKYLFRIVPSLVTFAKSNREEPRVPSKAWSTRTLLFAGEL